MNKDLPISELLLSYGDGIGTDEVLVPVDVIRAAVDRLEELDKEVESVRNAAKAGYYCDKGCGTRGLSDAWLEPWLNQDWDPDDQS